MIVENFLRERTDVYLQRCGSKHNDQEGDNDAAHISPPSPVDSSRLAVLTVSPNKQYLGIVSPTTPATHGPAIDDPMQRIAKR